jgi:hypothetical protein
MELVICSNLNRGIEHPEEFSRDAEVRSLCKVQHVQLDCDGSWTDHRSDIVALCPGADGRAHPRPARGRRCRSRAACMSVR